MDKASPSGGEDCRFESCRVYFHIPVAWHERHRGGNARWQVRIVPGRCSSVPKAIPFIARQFILQHRQYFVSPCSSERRLFRD